MMYLFLKMSYKLQKLDCFYAAFSGPAPKNHGSVIIAKKTCRAVLKYLHFDDHKFELPDGMIRHIDPPPCERMYR
jgi:hypothetical protein